MKSFLIEGASAGRNWNCDAGALVAHIADQVAKKPDHTGEKVLVVSADNYHAGPHGKVFIAIHADGSEPSCQVWVTRSQPPRLR
jgi:hypothetical protein